MSQVRHPTAPEPNACRWCGVPQHGHAHRWVASKRWHAWEPPTPTQRLARMLARRSDSLGLVVHAVPGLPADTIAFVSERTAPECRRRECDHVHESVLRIADASGTVPGQPT